MRSRSCSMAGQSPASSRVVLPPIGIEVLAPVLRPGRRPLAAHQGLEHGLGPGIVDVLVEVVVDPQHRRVGAGAQALELAQEEAAVRRRLADADAERRPCRRAPRRPSRTASRAWSCRPGPGCARPAPCCTCRRSWRPRRPGSAGCRGTRRRSPGRPRQPAAMLRLRQMQQRQHGALPARPPDSGPGSACASAWFSGVNAKLVDVGRHLAPDLGLAGRRAQRSISPNTMSIEPMIAGTSARVWPLLMKSSASRWT